MLTNYTIISFIWNNTSFQHTMKMMIICVKIYFFKHKTNTLWLFDSISKINPKLFRKPIEFISFARIYTLHNQMVNIANLITCAVWHFNWIKLLFHICIHCNPPIEEWVNRHLMPSLQTTTVFIIWLYQSNFTEILIQCKLIFIFLNRYLYF